MGMGKDIRPVTCSKSRAATDKLDENPKRGRIVPELFGQGISGYREMVVPPWRIIYKIHQGIVYILSAIDGRRNLEDILLERLIK